MELINEKEKRVLGALSKLGESPISAVARETLFKRTALYHTVDGLVEKGLVTRIVKDKVTFLRGLSVDEFDNWAKRNIASMNSELHTVKSWLESQATEQTSLYTDVRYFEGTEGIKNLYEDTWRNNTEKVIYAITDYTKAYKSMHQYFTKEYFPDRVSRGVSVKSLLPKSSEGVRDKKSEKDLLREMRFIDLFANLGIELNIYGSKVAVVAFDPKNPTGVVIKNETIALAFQKIFEYLWKSTK